MTIKPRSVASRTPITRNTRDHVRVMIVDDSLTARTAFTRMIEQEPGMTIAAIATTAESALAQLADTIVDVILLDLEMPGMGGLEAMPQILKVGRGAQVLVVSALTEAGARTTLSALAMGAADTLLKPRPGGFDDAYRNRLLGRVRALKRIPALTRRAPAKSSIPVTRRAGKRPQVIAIGASTGGIHALNLFLSHIPANFDLPILITQHLPIDFMPVFVRQMASAAGRKAVLAEDGTVLERGGIVIAPGYGHMVVRQAGARHITAIANHAVKSGCTPSVDPMFESLAGAFDGQVAGVLLSGMGRDGTDGAHAILRAGGTIFAQDAESSAVWGMPRAMAESGLASAILPPQQLADHIIAHAGPGAWR